MLKNGADGLQLALVWCSITMTTAGSLWATCYCSLLLTPTEKKNVTACMGHRPGRDYAWNYYGARSLDSLSWLVPEDSGGLLWGPLAVPGTRHEQRKNGRMGHVINASCRVRPGGSSSAAADDRSSNQVLAGTPGHTSAMQRRQECRGTQWIGAFLSITCSCAPT